MASHATQRQIGAALQNPFAPGSRPTHCASPCSTTSPMMQARSPDVATPHDWYMALAYSVHDRLLARWVDNRKQL